MEQIYIQACVQPSDINEHIPTLRTYANKCTHITECGVRSEVSSWAFVCALQEKENAKLVQVDLNTHANIIAFGDFVRNEGIDVVFYQQSDLECPIEKTDLLFIDTWHIYGQLKRELARWHSAVSKYIILHDTTVDGVYGETYRNGWDPIQQSKETGIPVDEIMKGLWPAVEEFLAAHPEWKLEKRYVNNNGLTVLARC